MGPEQNLWKWLKKETAPLVSEARLHICRVENMVGLGYPDVEGCFERKNFHLELKAAARPKRTTTPVKIRFEKQQIPWLKKRWKVGGRCWVLLRVGAGQEAKHYLIPGNRAELLKGKMTEEEIDEISQIDPDASGNIIIKSAASWLV